MRMKVRAFWSAFPSAMLVVILLGVLCVFCGYLLTEWGEGVLEAIGAVRSGWGPQHDRALVLVALALTLPLIIWAAVRYFRRAMGSEAELLKHGHG